MIESAYRELLEQDSEPERFARSGLKLIEADLRSLALLALSEWDDLRIPNPKLFSVVKVVHAPAFGTWRIVIDVLRRAVREAQQSQRKDVVEQVEGAKCLTDVLAMLRKRVLNPERLRAAQDLGKNQSRPARPECRHVFAIATSVRNRIEHGPELQASDWRQVAEGVRSLIEVLEELHAIPDAC